METDPPGSIFSSISYIIGATNFLIGSIAFIPKYYQTQTGQYIGAICYTFGSFCFCMADIAILYLLVTHKFRFLDRIALLLGSIMYVVGSSLFIPQIMASDAGDSLFISGSCMILLVRIWLYCKTKFRFPVIVVANLICEMMGAFSFLVGPAISIAGMEITSVTFYIVGSVFFLLASIFNLTIELVNKKNKEIQKQMDTDFGIERDSKGAILLD